MAILIQAICEARIPERSCPKLLRLKRSANDYIYSDSLKKVTDFLVICDILGLCKNHIRKIVIQNPIKTPIKNYKIITPKLVGF